jgi:hypothetical protein
LDAGMAHDKGYLTLSIHVDFHMLVKKSIGAIGFRFVPLDSSMFADSVALFAFVQGQ